MLGSVHDRKQQTQHYNVTITETSKFRYMCMPAECTLSSVSLISVMIMLKSEVHCVLSWSALNKLVTGMNTSFWKLC